MEITLNWFNPNAGLETGTRIFRSNAPITAENLPAPLATVGPGVTMYIDNTVVLGNMYYYRTQIFDAKDSYLTKTIAVRAITPEQTGAGPKNLTMGDWDMGVFGYIESVDLFKPDDVFALTNTTPVGLNNPSDYGWIKMAYKGKVLFIAMQPTRWNVSYAEVYAAGLVFGVNNNGPIVPSGKTPVNQFKPIMRNGFNYIPRILKGLADDIAAAPANIATNIMLVSDPGSSEWDDIVHGLTIYPRYSGQLTAPGRFGDLGYTFGINYSGSTQFTDMCQQTANLSSGVYRGVKSGYTVSHYPGPFFPLTVDLTYGQFSISGGQQAVYAAYRPVLELAI